MYLALGLRTTPIRDSTKDVKKNCRVSHSQNIFLCFCHSVSFSLSHTLSLSVFLLISTFLSFKLYDSLYLYDSLSLTLFIHLKLFIPLFLYFSSTHYISLTLYISFTLSPFLLNRAYYFALTFPFLIFANHFFAEMLKCETNARRSNLKNHFSSKNKSSKNPHFFCFLFVVVSSIPILRFSFRLKANHAIPTIAL